MPLSLSPINATPQRRADSRTDVETLCAALRQTQRREHELMACIQSTLERMHGRTPMTPPHMVHGNVENHTSRCEVLTVDAKAAWSRSRSPPQPVTNEAPLFPIPSPSPPIQPPCRKCSELEATIHQLQRDNVSLRQKQERLESAVEALQGRKAVSSLSPHFDSTPQRRLNHSNVLLHDSTQKLLAEAERQLQLQNASYASAF